MLRVEYDDAKNQANIAKHRVDMASASDFRFDTALTTRDTRRNYADERTIALGFIADTLHVLVFTMRGKALRVISLRRANRKERNAYYGKT
jgi:uncharacterized DUF497 family protein